jgi:hypothetical protein
LALCRRLDSHGLSKTFPDKTVFVVSGNSPDPHSNSFTPPKEAPIMRRFSAAAVALLVVFACTEGPTQPGELPDLRVEEQALIVGKLPGPQVMDFGLIRIPDSFCRATYEDVAQPPNSAISSRFLPADIRVVMNKNMIKATCTFLDTSGAYEGDAEIGVIENCRLVVDAETVYDGGTGRVTSAANIVDEVEGLPFGTGGNTTIQCTFDL